MTRRAKTSSRKQKYKELSKNKSKKDLIKALSKPKPKIRINKKKLEEIRKHFYELRYKLKRNR